MSGEPGIKAEKHRSVLHKDIKVNPKGLLMSLGKAAINGAFLKWDDLAENGVEVLEALGLEAKPGEIAGLLIVRSLVQAMKNLLDENKELLVKKPENLRALYKELNSSLDNGELVIEQDFFQRPKDLPIVQAAKTGFAKWLEEFVEKKVEADNISSRLPAYFVFALNEQWRTRSQDYAALKEVLNTPFTQASEREQGWLRYRAWLQKRVEEPMFLEAFSLKPMEGVIPRFNFRIEMWKARNAEEALLAVLNACARVTKATSEIKWQYRNSFGTWISRLQGQRIGVENVLALECLSFLDLHGCILYIRDFFRANLALANLEKAELIFANLEGANLEGANLTGANLQGASLEQANLEGAILTEANLAEANLAKANLAKANLQLANLYKTNLEGANLAGAILQWANFASANLEEANFEGANLEGTILEGKDIANLAEASNAGSDES